MSEGRRKQLYVWYEAQKRENRVFDLHEELLAYCISDVDILKRCCIQFRKLFMHITSTGPGDCGVDPFKTCITIASVCNLVFRRNFLAKDTITVLPPNDYNVSENQSKKALTWLRWISRLEGVIFNTPKMGGGGECISESTRWTGLVRRGIQFSNSMGASGTDVQSVIIQILFILYTMFRCTNCTPEQMKRKLLCRIILG